LKSPLHEELEPVDLVGDVVRELFECIASPTRPATSKDQRSTNDLTNRSSFRVAESSDSCTRGAVTRDLVTSAAHTSAEYGITPFLEAN
jgi:hypothetical protein